LAQWFLSDTHFGHFNILDYDGRPFSSVREMEDALVANIHSSIAADDQVYFLGDFSFNMKPAEVERIVERVTAKGRWYFVRGNHDHKRTVKVLKRYAEDEAVHDLLEVSPNGQLIVLCHYPLIQWNKSHYGAWHLHGHDHRTLHYGDGTARYNVAVNLNGYYPVSFNTLKEYFSV
jgi:calcineurin-like phosphoesterase family protein